MKRSFRSYCDAIVWWGLVALIAFTPFAFGTVERWSLALMDWAITILLLVYLIGRLVRGGETPSRSIRRTGLEIPIALFLVFIGCQLVPVPTSWFSVLSPGAAKAYAMPNLAEAVAQERPGVAPDPADPLLHIEVPSRRPLSISPDRTQVQFVQIVCLACLFFLTVWWADRSRRILGLLGAVTVVGFLVAAQGLIQYLTWNGKLLWFRKTPQTASFGPFVNHNHFAGYVEMIIPVAIGLCFHLMENRRVRVDSPPDAETGGLSGFVNADLRGSRQQAWGQAGLVLFAAVILVVSLLFSLSRGGIMASILSGVALLGLFWRRIRSRRLIWTLAIGLPAFVAVIAFWIGAGLLRERFGTQDGIENEASFRSRFLIWTAVARNFPEFLWVGSGLGTFEESFAPYTPPGSVSIWDKAHNDYLQAAWETGIIGLVLFGAVASSFVMRYVWPGISSRGDPLDLFRIAISISMLSIALHSVVDFNLQIGANSFLFVLLAGLLVALQRVRPEARAAGAKRVDHEPA